MPRKRRSKPPTAAATARRASTLQVPGEQAEQQRGGMQDGVAGQSAERDVIALSIARGTGPRIPVLHRARDHAHFGMGQQEGVLTAQLVGKPDVVGVAEGDGLSARVAQPQIPRRAHAAIGVARVLQVPHAIGSAGRGGARQVPAAVARAIIDQQQLPVGEPLSAHAVDRLGEPALGVEKDDDRAHRRRGQPTSPASHVSSWRANVSPSQSRTCSRGTWNGSVPRAASPGKFAHAPAKPSSRTSVTVPPS
jgi:hypothetical protein